MTHAANTTDVLMVDPRYYNIEYAINPFMTDANGNLNQVNQLNALNQWKNLKLIFEQIGVNVYVLQGEPSFPDMVFCANQAFPFLNYVTQEKSVLLSNMRADQRKGEVSFFKEWFQKNNYQIYTLEDKKYSFEANGDLIPVPGTNKYWGGVGPRTDEQVYQEIQIRFHLDIETLHLVHSHFYHLDTCFFVVNQDICAYVKQAFPQEDVEKIRKHFVSPIEIPIDEAIKFFAGNAFSPDGKNVVMQPGALVTKRRLENLGLRVHEADTSEYMKSGGSVFCMKLALP